MSTTKIVISSVLKPIHDTRLYEKIAQSIHQTFPTIDIHLLAHYSQYQTQKVNKKIFQKSIFHFSRLHPRRFLANFILFKHLWKIRPKLVIVATFELLPAAVLYKLVYKTVLIYDVQENYYLNIAYTRVFPPVLKNILASIVRAVERVAHPWIDHYWLAEECYLEEMPYTQKKGTLIRNKFKRSQLPASVEKSSSDQIQFLYSGTISEDYGIFRAINFMHQLHQVYPFVHLKIIGFCPQEITLRKLKAKLQEVTYLSLEGGESTVSHERIIRAIQESDYMLLPYYQNRSVEKRIPTKVYEALALQIPMLIQENAYWKGFLNQFSFEVALWIDFDDLSGIEETLKRLKKTVFFHSVDTIRDIFWEDEFKRCLYLLDKFLLIDY